jgi:enoyl-CoA hydratase/carnithine racemase
MNSSLITFDEINCAAGRAGVVTFNNPKSLNALTLEMFQALHSKLKEWRDDKNIRLLFFDSVTEKAFSAGGDVKVLGLRANENIDTQLVEEFFWWEYGTDYLVHSFPKPIICWLDGITMGGGVGISNGASHRIVTEETTWSMPELQLGFFPDVAAAYFLNQLPEQIALFLAWTGARITGADALHLRLADICLPSAVKDGILNVISQTEWSDNGEENHQMVGDLLGSSELEGVPTHLIQRQEQILRDLNSHSVEEALIRYLGLKTEDQWLQECMKNFRHSSPLSAHVTYQHLKRGRGLTSQKVLVHDWSLAVNIVRKGDFIEGIRSVLIDKDRNPKWKHASFADVAKSEVDSLLAPAPGQDKFAAFLKSLDS